MTTRDKRQLVEDLVRSWNISIRKACGLIGIHRSTYFYKPERSMASALERRIREIAASRPGYGYRKIHVMLRREGWRVNVKRVYRIYRANALQVRSGLRTASNYPII